MINLRCPRCGLAHIKRNAHTHYRKQNYQCQPCGRQFVQNSQLINEQKRAMIKKLLFERVSLLGICRIMDVSLRWLLCFIATLYDSLPEDLNLRLPAQLKRAIELLRLQAEADEMWGFVGEKTNKQWVWIALDVETRQAIAFYVGDRSRKVGAQTVAASSNRVWKARRLCD